jgi:hypothetical protein
MTGYGRYYWRGFVDKTDDNYLVISALPTIFHQDERYYAMGKGNFWKRFRYSGTRVFLTPNYEGHNRFNVSELLGRGLAQGILLSYYPSQTRPPGPLPKSTPTPSAAMRSLMFSVNSGPTSQPACCTAIRRIVTAGARNSG